MPKVIITEKDLTNAGLVEENDNIVFIPGTALLDGLEAGEEKYFTYKDASTFTAKTGYDKTNVACKMTYRLISLGMTVLYRAIDSESELDAGEAFWDIYADKSRYNLRFLTAGGYTSEESANGMITCAAERGDAIALVDVPDNDITIDLELKSVTLRQKSGSEIVSEGAFQANAIEGLGHYVSGDISGEAVVKQALQDITFNPAAPETDPGTYTVAVSANYSDADGVVYPVAIATIPYTVA